MKKKTVAILMAIAMICSGVAGATVAWLTATSNTVTNTFTLGDINIELTETVPGENGGTAKMIPGSDIPKDPKVTVKAGSEDSWVFVKVEEKNSLDSYLNYNVKTTAGEWTVLDATLYPGVYYREYTATGTDTDYYILQGNTEKTGCVNGYVTVKDTVTKNDLETINESNPQLVFTAYAVQKENITSVTDAWAKVAPSTP